MRSRWLDIGQVLFLRVLGPRRSRETQWTASSWQDSAILPARVVNDSAGCLVYLLHSRSSPYNKLCSWASRFTLRVLRSTQMYKNGYRGNKEVLRGYLRRISILFRKYSYSLPASIKKNVSMTYLSLFSILSGFLQ